MIEKKGTEDVSEIMCYAWVLYGSPGDDSVKLQKEIDKIFSNYSFYPEIDWSNYGYRPPDGYQVMGAWRHSQSKVYAFLLDNPSMVANKSSIQFVLYVVGEKENIFEIEYKLKSLKTSFEIENKKDKDELHIEKRVERLQKKPLAILTGILTIFTAIINGFSLYLRKLPPPELGSTELINVYKYFILSVHFGALCLLLIVIIICFIFLIKYGILIIRRI